jgi:hypothetical protein
MKGLMWDDVRSPQLPREFVITQWNIGGSCKYSLKPVNRITCLGFSWRFVGKSTYFERFFGPFLIQSGPFAGMMNFMSMMMGMGGKGYGPSPYKNNYKTAAQ